MKHSLALVKAEMNQVMAEIELESFVFIIS